MWTLRDLRSTPSAGFRSAGTSQRVNASPALSLMRISHSKGERKVQPLDFLKYPASGPTTPSPDTGIPRSAATHHLGPGSLPAGTLREPISSPLKPSGERSQRNPYSLADFLQVEQIQSPPGSSSKPGKEVSCSKFEHEPTPEPTAPHGTFKVNRAGKIRPKWLCWSMLRTDNGRLLVGRRYPDSNPRTGAM